MVLSSLPRAMHRWAHTRAGEESLFLLPFSVLSWGPYDKERKRKCISVNVSLTCMQGTRRWLNSKRWLELELKCHLQLKLKEKGEGRQLWEGDKGKQPSKVRLVTQV